MNLRSKPIFAQGLSPVDTGARPVPSSRHQRDESPLDLPPVGSPFKPYIRSPIMGNPSPVPAPRGMNAIAAAKYVGISPGTFRKLVRVGIMPPPLNIPEIERNVFDRVQIDDAMSARAVRHGEVTL
jgi:hypothetical protein